MASEFDVVVIGAGTGGYVAAIRAAQLGLKVAVVEKQKALGGTCLIWGCIPTKALLEHAHALKVVQNVKEWGVTIGEGAVGIDMNQVQTRKDKRRVRPHQGHRVPVQEEQDRVDQGHRDDYRPRRSRRRRRRDADLSAAKEIVIATGSAPRSVPGVEIDRKRIITSDEAIGLREVPKSMVILGSGAVGVEFASIFRRFGSQVTIIELLPRIVPAEDEAISAELTKSFKKQGITIHTGTKVTKATAVARPASTIEAQLPDGAVEKMTADYLLVATGRGPVTQGLGSRRARAEPRPRLHHRRQAVPDRRARVFGCRRRHLVRRSGRRRIRSSRTCRRRKASSPRSGSRGRTPKPINYDHVPACTYCDPEIGSVGLTEREAQEQGYDVRVGTFPFFVLGRAKMAGESEGFVKIVADKKYDEVLGVHMIGPRATELVAEATLALRLECTVEELIRTIHAHPTFPKRSAKPHTPRTARRYICSCAVTAG